MYLITLYYVGIHDESFDQREISCDYCITALLSIQLFVQIKVSFKEDKSYL